MKLMICGVTLSAAMVRSPSFSRSSSSTTTRIRPARTSSTASGTVTKGIPYYHSLSLAGLGGMGPDSSRDQAEPADQQDQHDQRVEKGGRLKIDVHVGNHARQDEQGAGHGKQPSDNVSTVKKQHANAD